jgi:hypothetical protein
MVDEQEACQGIGRRNKAQVEGIHVQCRATSRTTVTPLEIYTTSISKHVPLVPAVSLVGTGSISTTAAPVAFGAVLFDWCWWLCGWGSSRGRYSLGFCQRAAGLQQYSYCWRRGRGYGRHGGAAGNYIEPTHGTESYHYDRVDSHSAEHSFALKHPVESKLRACWMPGLSCNRPSRVIIMAHRSWARRT